MTIFITQTVFIQSTMLSTPELFAALKSKMATHKKKVRELIDIQTDLQVHVALLETQWQLNMCQSPQSEFIAQSATHITRELVEMTLNNYGDFDEQSILSSVALSSTATRSSMSNEAQSPAPTVASYAPSNDNKRCNSSLLCSGDIKREMLTIETLPTDNDIQQMSFMTTGVCQFQCAACKHRFPTEDSLQRHTQRCRSMQCSVCHRYYSNKKRFDLHVKAHDRGTEYVASKLAKRNEQRPTEKKSVCCRVCGKKFMRHVDLLKHSRLHKGKQSTLYNCNVCGKTFMSQEVLKLHAECHVALRPGTEC